MPRPNKNIIYRFFSLLYGAITGLRNLLFDIKVLPSRRFQIPIISVGNLAVGGTGKTPHTEFLLKELGEEWKIAVLSRGYKRKTSGFHVARLNDNAETIGDEPFQIYTKFPLNIVAVDSNRVRGIKEILDLRQGVEAIVLDDAFQHRHVKPGLSILLTDYSNLYSRDFMLPYGTLREWRQNSKRADIVIVTKCDDNINQMDRRQIAEELRIKAHQQLFFSSFNYGALYPANSSQTEERKIDAKTHILLLAGIEKPQDMQQYLQKQTKHITPLFFRDHHDFSKKDIATMAEKFKIMQGKKMIVTTEKDFARLKSIAHLPEIILENLFILPIEVKIEFSEQEVLIQKIRDYVRKNSTNS